MGGTVTCKSKIGVGTEFKIKLNTKCKKQLNNNNMKKCCDQELIIIYKKNEEQELTNIMHLQLDSLKPTKLESIMNQISRDSE